MRFNSLLFLTCLPLFWCLWYGTPFRFRWMVLLAGSYLFYACVGAPCLLITLALVTVGSYAVGRALPRLASERGRTVLFWGGAVFCLSFLGVFKYLPGFFVSLFPIWAPPAVPGGPPGVLIMAGVSFFVFQAVSYLADVYLEVLEPEKHLGYYAVYLAFFPKLLQGPIERGDALLPQLHEPVAGFQYDNMRTGAVLFFWGLFKKIVIADHLAILVDPVFNDVHAFAQVPLRLATYAYALQLYFDFSGYTDMALGIGRLFNIRLTQNFNSPYLATSMADFWRRWHITFSRWILDYIFKPLQMALRDWRLWGTALALLITFLFSGVWHGNTWNFVVWGGLHGLFLAMGVFTRNGQKKLFKKLRLEGTWYLQVVQILVTFHLVCFTWIFFRARNLSDAAYVVTHLFSASKGTARHADAFFEAASPMEQSILAVSLSVTARVLFLKLRKKELSDLFAQPFLVRWGCYYAIVALVFYLFCEETSKFQYMGF
ncbi:MAG TPA: MBOAT family O-acyltransferase [Candidatus Sumerlaeota bacterium]|nr:MBOAT family O-acyltransferase [Candidatus Sumerlaeota bacterium]